MQLWKPPPKSHFKRNKATKPQLKFAANGEYTHWGKRKTKPIMI